MPKIVKPLTDTVIRSAKSANGKPRKLFDGKGLHLLVTPEGKKFWRMDFNLSGRRSSISFGAYPEVGLSEARERVNAARALVVQGLNPAHERAQKAASTAQAEKLAAENTIRAVALRVITETKSRSGAKLSETTGSKKHWIMGKFDNAFLEQPISKVTLPQIVEQLDHQAAVGAGEIAFRMYTLMKQTFRLAEQKGLITYDPARNLPRPTRNEPVKNRAAITKPQAFGELLKAIDAYAARNLVTGAALQLSALLYQRPGELRMADWAEFDLEGAKWEIPAHRMKMKRAHTVPLSRQAIAILERLKEFTGNSGYAFPSNGRKAVPLSENAMGQALKAMGYTDHTAHGFRASASTLLNESHNFAPATIEVSLAHGDPDKVRAAYARSDFWHDRVAMAQWWADYCDRLKAGETGDKVIPMVKKI